MQTTRRNLLKVAGAAVAVEAGSVLFNANTAAAADSASKKLTVLGFSGSNRLGKTTAASVQIVLDSIREKDPNIETELIELSNYRLTAYPLKGAAMEPDDFETLAQKIREENVVGLVFGTPCYFGSLSSLLKIFFEKFTAFRKGFDLKNKIVGAVAVGANRSGGQERCIEQIWTALSSQQVIFAQDAPPTSHWGGTLWNQNDTISGDEFGQSTAKNLGIRIVELARLIR